MQLPTLEEYEQIDALARSYRDRYIRQLKRKPVFNPRLGVDGLCFQRDRLEVFNGTVLIGALITPCALWLAAIPGSTGSPAWQDSVLVSLPSGAYRFQWQPLPDGQGWYTCRILDDLSDLQTMQEAAQLAQRLMERIMAPAA
ncbi:[NiFe]-hydrogenase assembly chaperone HybE [Halomonas sp. BLK-85]